MHTNAVNTARYVYIIKCMCMFSWWISSNDTTSTVFPKCKCLLILILFHQSRESGKSLLRQIASARASVEPPRDCSFSQELSLGHLLTDPAQALMSPVDQVSPMNLNFNTPQLVSPENYCPIFQSSSRRAEMVGLRQTQIPTQTDTRVDTNMQCPMDLYLFLSVPGRMSVQTATSASCRRDSKTSLPVY